MVEKYITVHLDVGNEHFSKGSICFDPITADPEDPVIRWAVECAVADLKKENLVPSQIGV